MASYETIYIGRDNTIDLILKADGEAVDLSSVTQIDVSVGGVVIESSNADTDAIRWAQVGYDTGEIRISFGSVDGLVASSAKKWAYIVIYDLENPDGVVWGSFPVLILSV